MNYVKVCNNHADFNGTETSLEADNIFEEFRRSDHFYGLINDWEICFSKNFSQRIRGCSSWTEIWTLHTGSRYLWQCFMRSNLFYVGDTRMYTIFGSDGMGFL